MDLIITEKKKMAILFAEALLDKTIANRYTLKGNTRSYLFTNGHMFQLEEKFKTWDISAVSRILKGEISKTIKDELFIKEALELIKNCDKVIIATDYDTEGEVIGRDVLEILKSKKPVLRWKFSSLETKELRKSYFALEELFKSDFLYFKGEARRQLDFLEGISATKIINLKKITGKLNKDNSFYTIGRVKAGILRLLYQRELLVTQYLEKAYYEYKLVLTFSNLGQIETSTTKDYVLKENLKYTCSIKTKVVTEKPPKPYNTKRLIKKLVLKYDPEVITKGLEFLYYQGLISYPRTDTELFDNNYYTIALSSKFISEEEIMSAESFKKISINEAVVDHPAISLSFSTNKDPGIYLKLYEDLKKILVEPLRKTITKEVPYLEVIMDNHVFTTENKKYFEFNKPLSFLKEERRVYKTQYSLSELLDVMDKKKIGTKSTQLPSLCDLESKRFFKRNSIIVPNSPIISEIIRRLNLISKNELIFNLQYCKEVQESLDSIKSQKELEITVNNIKEKWKEIVKRIS